MSRQVTLIVPCWQAEQYIEPFWKALKSQTFNDFNVIFAVDGATDATLDKCHKIAARDNRVTVLDLPHGGVSAVRNAGIKACTTPWFALFDIDDKPHENMMDCLCNNLDDDCDLIVCGVNHIHAGIHVTPHLLPKGNVDVAEAVVDLGDALLATVHAKCFRKALLEKSGVKFDTNMRLSEDTLFMWEYIQLCRRVNMLDQIAADYIASSLQHKYKIKGSEAAYGLERLHTEIGKIGNRWGMDVSMFYQAVDRMYIQSVLRYSAGIDGYSDFVSNIKDLTHKRGYLQAYPRHRFFRWVECGLIIRTPRLGYYVRKTF